MDEGLEISSKKESMEVTQATETTKDGESEPPTDTAVWMACRIKAGRAITSADMG
jgi:hypothetical protein